MTGDLELLRRIDEKDYLTGREHREFLNILTKRLEAVDLIKKCYYFSSFSGQLMKSSYGFENPQEIRRIEDLLK